MSGCRDAVHVCLAPVSKSVSFVADMRVYTYTIVPCGNKNIIPEERIEKRGREGLDGRVCGHWSVRGGAFGVPAKREVARDSMAMNA